MTPHRNKDAISSDVLNECNLFIVGGPRESLDEGEIKDLKAWLAKGGRVLFLLGNEMNETTLSSLNTLFSE